MQLIQTTFPEIASLSFNTGTIVLIISTMSIDSIGNSGIVRFVHSKVTIPLPPFDIVYLVERSSASVAVLTSHSTLGFDVGDPVVFMKEIFGGFDSNTIYYIRSKVGVNSFTLSLSDLGNQILLPAKFSSVMSMFSAYSAVITRASGVTLFVASPSLISVGDRVKTSSDIVPQGINSKPSPYSFTLSKDINSGPIPLNEFGGVIITKYIERRCLSVTQAIDSSFTCSNFPAFNDGNFAAIQDRFYSEKVMLPNSFSETSVCWTLL
jgi:hypothetical protein